jgi:hypothetical protein
MTVTGLATVNFANFHWYSQVVVFFIIILGGQVWKHTLQVGFQLPLSVTDRCPRVYLFGTHTASLFAKMKG